MRNAYWWYDKVVLPDFTRADILACMQDLEDGTYHDDEEVAGSLALPLHQLRAVSWSTMHSLNLGDNDHSPVLLLDVDPAGKSTLSGRAVHNAHLGI